MNYLTFKRIFAGIAYIVYLGSTAVAGDYLCTCTATKKVAHTAQTKKQNFDIALEHVTSKEELLEAKNIFKRSFLKAYEHFSPTKDLKLKEGDTTENFLDRAFQDEIDDFDNNKVFFPMIAKCNQKIVAYTAFNTPSVDGKIYIRALAVDPEFGRCGIGENLVFACTILFKLDIKTIRLLTRKINEGARGFYQKKLGFTACTDADLFNEIPKEHQSLYTGYQYQVKATDLTTLRARYKKR